MKRRRFKQMASLEEPLLQEAQRAQAQAKILPPGQERELLLKKARDVHLAAHINEWLTSPGLHPPK
nr:hypothetical protein [Bradyrhizobium sp. 157]